MTNCASVDIESMINQGMLDEAEQAISFQIQDHQITPSRRIQLHALLGDIWFYRNAFKKAMSQYQLAFQLANDSQAPLLQAEQMKNIGITYSHMIDYGAALMWHEQALNLLTSAKIAPSQQHFVEQIKLSVLLSQGVIFSYVGAPELAVETIYAAQNLAYQSSNAKALNNAFLRLAALSFEKQDHASSLAAINAIDLENFTEMTDLSWYFGLKFNVLMALKKWPEAEQTIDVILNHSINCTSSYND